MNIYEKVKYYLERPDVSQSEVREALGNLMLNDEIELTEEQADKLVKMTVDIIKSHD